MIEILKLDLQSIEEQEYNSFPDKIIFTTLPWVRFIIQTQKAEPVILKIRENGRPAGYFTGLIISKLGLKIMGSPFKGWTTSFMGFDLYDPDKVYTYLKPVISYCFRELKCCHFEMAQFVLDVDKLKSLGLNYLTHPGYLIDLNKSEEELFANLKSECRTCIRKFAKSGCTIVEDYSEEFAEEYYCQLQDVFAKQGLIPTYSLFRVKALLNNLKATNMLLCLKALAPDGKCIATGIFPGFNKHFMFWGGASYRQDQHYRPNEAIQWQAIKYWQAKGVRYYEMGGGGDYKKKYGGEEFQSVRIIASKYKFLIWARNFAQKVLTQSKLRGIYFRVKNRK